MKQQPFWVDDPDAFPPSYAARPDSYLQRGLMITRLAIYALGMVALLTVMSSILPRWVSVAFLTYVAIQVVAVFFIRRRRGKARRDAMEIQQEARRVARATEIGSAVHVAGHPALQRDQPVVLALTEGELRIFPYESPHSIGTIPLRDITAVKTVVYDDERTPHDDVIDSSAQALLLLFTRGGFTGTCLFRRMAKVKPIDWYHALQRERHRLAAQNQGAA